MTIWDNYPGNLTVLFKTGYNPDVDDSEEDMWAVGGSYVFPAAEQQMEVVSSDAADTAAGTGAQTVKIWYLDDTFTEKTETVTLNGLASVATAATDIYRINAFRVITAGTGKVAAGNIDIRNLADTPIYSRIAAGHTRARNSIYTVPINKVLNVAQLTFSVGHSSGGRYARFTLRATYDDRAGASSSVFYPYYEVGVQDGAICIPLEFPIKLPAGTDVKLSVISDAGNSDAMCTGSYLGWLS